MNSMFLKQILNFKTAIHLILKNSATINLASGPIMENSSFLLMRGKKPKTRVKIVQFLQNKKKLLNYLGF